MPWTARPGRRVAGGAEERVLASLLLALEEKRRKALKGMKYTLAQQRKSRPAVSHALDEL
jgi:hypothetical protein